MIPSYLPQGALPSTNFNQSHYRNRHNRSHRYRPTHADGPSWVRVVPVIGFTHLHTTERQHTLKSSSILQSVIHTKALLIKKKPLTPNIWNCFVYLLLYHRSILICLMFKFIPAEGKSHSHYSVNTVSEDESGIASWCRTNKGDTMDLLPDT